MEIVLSISDKHPRSTIYGMASSKRADIIQQAWLDFFTTEKLTESQWTALVDHSAFLGVRGRELAHRECKRYGHDWVKVPTMDVNVCRRCVSYGGGK